MVKRSPDGPSYMQNAAGPKGPGSKRPPPPRRCAMRHPAHDAAGEKRRDHRRGRNCAPGARGTGDLLEIEPYRYRLRCDRVVARTKGVRLRPPVGDARGMLRMGGKATPRRRLGD